MTSTPIDVHERVRRELAGLLEARASDTIPVFVSALPGLYQQRTGRTLKQDLSQAGLGKKLRAALEQLRDICDIGEVPSPASWAKSPTCCGDVPSAAGD